MYVEKFLPVYMESVLGAFEELLNLQAKGTHHVIIEAATAIDQEQSTRI